MLEALVIGLFLSVLGTICFIQEAIENRDVRKDQRWMLNGSLAVGAEINVVLCLVAAVGIQEIDKLISRGSTCGFLVIGGLAIALCGLAYLVALYTYHSLANWLLERYAPSLVEG